MQLLGVLIIFAFVLVITYFTTRWIGGFQKAQLTGGYLQVVETVRVANNKYIQIVKTGKVYLVIAVGKDEVSLLAQLTEEQLGELTEQKRDMVRPLGRDQIQGVADTFQETLDKVRKSFPKKRD